MDDLISVVDWSRWQFALTAMYHWLFVPLTIGLALIVAIMESIYVKTRAVKWLAMTKFWMLLFGINFVCRRHIRRSARDRGYSGFLHGIDIYSSDVFRMEEGQPGVSSYRYMAHGYRHRVVSNVDSDRQRVDAAACRDGV